MEYHVARAMRIFNLSPGEIDLLHAREKSINRLLVPEEIEFLLGLGTIKDELGYGYKDDELLEHNLRVKMDIESVYKSASFMSRDDLTSFHAYDKLIQEKKEDIRFQSIIIAKKKNISSKIDKLKRMEYLND